MRLHAPSDSPILAASRAERGSCFRNGTHRLSRLEACLVHPGGDGTRPLHESMLQPRASLARDTSDDAPEMAMHLSSASSSLLEWTLMTLSLTTMPPPKCVRARGVSVYRMRLCRRCATARTLPSSKAWSRTARRAAISSTPRYEHDADGSLGGGDATLGVGREERDGRTRSTSHERWMLTLPIFIHFTVKRVSRMLPAPPIVLAGVGGSRPLRAKARRGARRQAQALSR